VRVDAESDSQAMAIAGSTAAGGVAAVGPAASLIALDPPTDAWIGAGADVTAADDVSVEAHNQTDLLTDATGSSVSDIGASGSAAAIALGGQTYAYVDAGADVLAGGSAQILAQDSSTLENVAGSVAGASLAAADGSAALNLVNKDTQAWIGDGAHVTALDATPDIGLALNPDPAAPLAVVPSQGVSVLADSTELAINLVANGAGSGGAAFIGGAGAVLMGDVTKAYVGADAVVSAAANVSVGALDLATTWVGVASVSDASLALSGAADVGVIRNQISAAVDPGASLKAGGDIDVAARSAETVDSFVGGLGGSQGGVALDVSASVYSIGAVVPGDLLDPLASVNGKGDLGAYLDGLLQGMVGAANDGVVGALGRYAGAAGANSAAAQLAALTPASPVTGALSAQADAAGTSATVNGATLDAQGKAEVTAVDSVTPSLDTSFTLAVALDGLNLALDGGLLAGRANAAASVLGGADVEAQGEIDVLADATTSQDVSSTFAFNNSTGDASATVDGATLLSGGAVKVESDMEGSNRYSGVLPGFSGLKARTSENEEANTSAAAVTDGASITAAGALIVSATTNSTNKVVADGATLLGDGFDGAFTLGVALAWNDISDTTSATISGSRAEAQSVAVKATAATNDTSVALGAADGSNDAVVIGGSAARNILADTVSATVEGSTVSATDGVAAEADDAMTLLAISSGAAARSRLGITGAVSDTTTTDAVTGALDVPANDASEIKSGSGAAAGAGTVAGGAAVAVNRVIDDVAAEISGGAVSARGAVDVAADDKGAIESIPAVGTGAGTVALDASVSINAIGGAVSAAIAGKASVRAGGAVAAKADNQSEIDAISGAISISGVVGGGAAIARNRIGDTSDESGPDVVATLDKALDHPASDPAAAATTASIESGASVRAYAVSVSAAFSGKVKAAAVGGAGAGTVALAGAVTDNLIGDQISADILDRATSVQATHDVKVSASHAATIDSLAGALSASGVASGGAAVAVDKLDGSADALVKGAEVTSLQGGVSLAGSQSGDRASLTSTNANILIGASDTAGIDSLSAAAGDGVAAISGAVSVNELGDSVKAVVNDSAVAGAFGVAVQATETGGVKSAAGNLAGGVAGVGGSAAYNQIENAVAAAVEGGATVRAALGDVMAQSLAKDAIQTLSAGGAAGVAGIGGSVSVSIVADRVSSDVVGSTASAFGNLGVIADDQDSVKAWGGEIAGGVVGAAASVSVVTLKSRTNAHIDASTVAALGATAPILAIGVDPSTGAATTGQARGVVVDARDLESADVKAQVGAGTEIDAAGDIAVTASDTRKISSDVDAGAGGFLALGGALSILSMGGSIDPATAAAIDANGSHNAAGLSSQLDEYVDQAKPGAMIHPGDGAVAANWLAEDNAPLPSLANPLADAATPRRS
jgi:hypothetical protein